MVGSYFWNKLQKFKEWLKGLRKWRIGDGVLVRFWEDPWLKDVPLSQVTGLRDLKGFLEPQFGEMVKDYLEIRGGRKEWKQLVVTVPMELEG